MNRVRYFLVVASLALVGVSRDGAAQVRPTPPFSQPVGIQSETAARLSPEQLHRAGQRKWEDDHAGPPTYFLAGSLVGAAAAGIFTAIELSKCVDDCGMMATPMTFFVVGAGALVGGLSGLLVYAFRYGG
jgi:hypothetical protein